MSEARTSGNGTDVALRNVDMPLEFAVLEHVLGTGDLSKLSTQQRVAYYRQTCDKLGLNPLTRPFRFMAFQGQIVMYATRDAADQLRSLRKISLAVVNQKLDGDLFIVTVRATTPDGRSDEDMGAVTMGRLQGDARANAILKAITKAKRRVTLSICGLGFNDETEIETLPEAKTFEHDADQPPVATAQPIARDPAVVGRMMDSYERGEARRMAAAFDRPSLSEWVSRVVISLEADGLPQWRWLRLFLAAVERAPTRADLEALGDVASVQQTISQAPPNVRQQIEAAMADKMGFFDQAAEADEATKWAEPPADTAGAPSLDDALPPDLPPTVDADAKRVAELVALIGTATSAEQIDRQILGSMINTALIQRFTRDGRTDFIAQIEAARQARFGELGVGT